MSQRYKLYRRTSGIYVVRISVPQRFRRYAGQCEIHTSTGTHDLHEAKQKSALLLAVWYQTLQEYEQLDYRTLSDCAPLLAGEGMISLSNFAQSVELPVAQLIQAVMNRNLPVFWLATGQAGFYVAALSEAELDPLDGSYVLNYGEEKGIEGLLKAICNSLRNQHIYVTLLATVIQKLRCSKLPEATLKAVGFSPPVGR